MEVWICLFRIVSVLRGGCFCLCGNNKVVWVVWEYEWKRGWSDIWVRIDWGFWMCVDGGVWSFVLRLGCNLYFWVG